jgi:hypothetical protein
MRVFAAQHLCIKSRSSLSTPKAGNGVGDVNGSFSTISNRAQLMLTNYYFPDSTSITVLGTDSGSSSQANPTCRFMWLVLLPSGAS